MRRLQAPGSGAGSAASGYALRCWTGVLHVSQVDCRCCLTLIVAG